MIGSQAVVRVLSSRDMPDALDVLAADPVVNVFAEYRTRLTQLEPRWLGGEMWGYYEDGRLSAMCHVGANLVPIMASDDACAAFAERAGRRPPTTSTIVGPARAVRAMWDRLEHRWAPPREYRWDQPHLQVSAPPDVDPDPAVRPTNKAETELLYPASVAMYTEEVGVSPEAEGGRDFYRARVAQLISRGWSFSRIEDGEVLFKADVAAVTPSACQIQGVYVDPRRRGEGLGTHGMATVVRHCLEHFAPTVSLYVNGHNAAAREVYRRVGFEQTDTFATLMW